MTLNRVIAGLAVTVFMVAWAPAASAFCTVAGGCEPTPVGTLSVTFIGTGEKPAPAKFLVYPQGVPASHRNVVVSAATAKPVELATGAYDVKVIGAPPLWARGVVIELDKMTAIELGGLSELLVVGNDSDGKPVKAKVVVYLAVAKRNVKNIVTIGNANQPFQVIAGTYDIRAKLRPDVWFESVAIARGKTLKISLPEPSSLQIAVADADGKPLRKNVFIQGLGSKKGIRSTKRTNTEISITPGQYDIRVPLVPTVWFRKVKVASGQAINLQIPQRGRLLVRMGRAGSGSSKRFWVYLPGKKNKTVVTNKTGKPIAIGPGKYDVRVKVAGKWQIFPVIIKPGKTTAIQVPAG